MRNPWIVLAGMIVFAAPILTAPVAGQQPAPPQGDRGVQVGVPAGRGGLPAEPVRGRAA
jgi:hypothetical protein